MSAILFPAVILCGGKSRRMGRPKALEPLRGHRLIDHAAARIARQASPVLINSNDPDIFLPGLVSFADEIAGFQGPLAGIHASLVKVQQWAPGQSHILVVPVDCPFVPLDLAERLATGRASPDTVVIAGSKGQIHPVTGLWPVALTGRLGDWLLADRPLRVSTFLETCAVKTVWFDALETPDGPLDPFFNINTPEDLEFARRMSGRLPPES